MKKTIILKEEYAKKVFFLFSILITLLTIYLPQTSSASYSFPDNIDTQQERINIQTVLNQVLVPSPNLVVDGVLGRKSIQAIQVFQELKGLISDGKPGPITRKALETAQVSFVSGCKSGDLFNATTGQPCGVNQTPSTPLVYTPELNIKTLEQEVTPPTQTNTNNSYLSIVLTSPVNGTTVSSNNVSLNFTATGNPTSCWYDLGGLRVEDGLIGNTEDPAYQYQLPGCQSRTITLPNRDYVLNLWTKDIQNNTNFDSTWFNVLATTNDTIPPIVTAFGVPPTATSLTVPVSPFLATDNIAVTGRLLTETSTIPSPSSNSWATTTPTSYTFSSPGNKTLYAWAKDAAGNVSNSLNDTVTITINGAAPTINNQSTSSLPDRLTEISTNVSSGNSTTTVYLEYSRTTDYKIEENLGTISAGNSQTLSHNIVNLPIGTYHWRIRAVNNSGTTVTPDQTLNITTQQPWRTTDSTGDKNYYTAGSTYYIDPTVAVSGNGSIDSPWKSWSNIVWGDNRIYLFKRGTTLIEGNFSRGSSMSNVTFGAYGTGNRPQLLSNSLNLPPSDNTKIFDLGSSLNNVIISGLEIGHQSSRVTDAVMNFPGMGAGPLLIEDCYIHGAEFGIRFEANTGALTHENVTIRNSVISDTDNDGIYMKKMNHVTIENTYIHHVNQDWFPGANQDQANGDGIQFIGADDVLLSGVKIDKSDTANKFAVIHQHPNTNAVGYEIAKHINCEYISHLNGPFQGSIIYIQSNSNPLRPQNVTVINSIFRGNSTNTSTSVPGIDATRSYLTSEDNLFINLPKAFNNRESAIMTSEDDTFTNVPIIQTGGVTFIAPVLGVSTFNFTHDLKQGSTGSEVKELQKILIEKGYLKGTPDGNFGQYTQAALKVYQKANGLKADGIVGNGTRAVLNK